MGAVHKLFLDDDLDDDFELFAIHTTLEMYRIAFFLNKIFKLNLAYKNTIDSFDLFEYKNIQNQEKWNLVTNTGERLQKQTKDTLIFDTKPIKMRTYLIPEHKNVDCFLKIENFNQNDNILPKISKIHQVITAFKVNVNQLKSKNNLIFY